MATFISHSPGETEELGEAWGRMAQRGLVIGLSGELGAGKTQLVKGFARGLGITARVHSPTFTLINVYAGGRLTLYHLDLYRLDTREQIIAAGLEEYLRPEGVTVIEWADRLLEWEEGRVSRVEGGEGRGSRVEGGEGRGSRVEGTFHRVLIEAPSETERTITYDDFSG
jgi:tRNA threonylcarbamoyladenosine biosynthesis protein TsaE